MNSAIEYARAYSFTTPAKLFCALKVELTAAICEDTNLDTE